MSMKAMNSSSVNGPWMMAILCIKSLFYGVNPFTSELFWKVAKYAHKFDKVLQKRVLLGIGMKEWVSIGVRGKMMQLDTKIV